MNSKNFLSILVLMSFTGISQQTFAMDDQQKHIVVSMRFLVHPNRAKAKKKLGIKGAIQSGLSGNFDEQSNIQEIFGLIRSLDFGHDETETLSWSGEQVPAPMVHWLKGKIACAEILEQLKGVIKEKYKMTTRLDRISEMIFEPTTCADVLTPSADAFRVIYDLQRQGHTVHVLGNWHEEIRNAIVARHSLHFSQILTKGGKVTVSGELGEVKCVEHPEIYRTFIQSLAEPPAYEQCYFIEGSDAELDTIRSLDEENPPSVLVADVTDIPSLARQLHEHGLLPEE